MTFTYLITEITKNAGSTYTVGSPFSLLAVPLGGLFNRMRGGLFGDTIRKAIPFYHDVGGRIVFSVPTGIFGWYVHQDWRWLCAIPFVYIGACLGHGQYMGLDGVKREGARDNAILTPVLDSFFEHYTIEWQALGLILTGLLTTFLISIPIWFADWSAALVLFAGGWLMWPCYYVGKHTQVSKNGLNAGPEMSEVFWGWFLWLLVWVA